MWRNRTISFQSIIYYYASDNFAKVVTYLNVIRLTFKEIESFILKVDSHNEARLLLYLFMQLI